MVPGRAENTATRSARNTASPRLWVTNTMVLWVAAKRTERSSPRIMRVCSSSAPNGSSISRMPVCRLSARASAARWRMPPESCAGKWSAKSLSPTASSERRARSARSGLATPWKRMPRSTFSITVFQGNRAFSWNTKAMSCGIGPVTGLPDTSTVPAVGVSSPPMTLSKVLLPQPDGPIRHNSSPRAMSKEVSSSARTLRASPSSPKRCETCLIRMAMSPPNCGDAAMALTLCTAAAMN